MQDLSAAALPPEVITTIGAVAGLLTTIAFAPQMLKAWRTRQTADISLAMFLILTTGIVLWLGYGLLLGDLPLILANGATLAQVAVILWLKLRHG